jgi:hypothetical protein
VGFEPTIAVLERTKTVRALDRSTTAIGYLMGHEYITFCNVSDIVTVLLCQCIPLKLRKQDIPVCTVTSISTQFSQRGIVIGQPSVVDQTRCDSYVALRTLF